MTFDSERAIGQALHTPDTVLSIVANRYLADNPPIPFTFRGYCETGVRCGQDGMFRMDFSARYPDAPHGAYAYAAARIYAIQDCPHGMFLYSPGGTEMYVNGELVYRSTVADERARGQLHRLAPPLHRGWNDLVLKCKNICPGQFGFAVSSNSPKWAPMLFYAPFCERAGQIGFALTGWFPSDVLGAVPDLSDSEMQQPELAWLPERAWNAEQRALPPSVRLFGAARAVAWSRVTVTRPETVRFTIHAAGPVLLFVGGQQFTSDSGTLCAAVPLTPGEHDVLVSGAAFTVESSAHLALPRGVQGVPGPWLYAGPFPDDLWFDAPANWCTLYRLFDGVDGPVYWRADLPDTVIRPCLENSAFGKWSYPHGVTLYGLLEAGRALGRTDIVDYAAAHAAECVRLYPYSKWDRAQYGYPCINQQLLWFSALDDVGSFGSFVLELAGDKPDSNTRQVADDIAQYLRSGVTRTPEGAFFRDESSDVCDMWADDLYMSVPFLVRYAALSGDTSFLDDAARQFLIYKDYLYMKDAALFSHVYDFRRGAMSRVPWGRGNGWALFSLSELMMRLPENHALYTELAALYKDFAGGVMACQDKSGMWHQVLNEPSTYEETSCTAMMICALSRGVRLGLLAPEGAADAVFNGWEGLTQRAIDRQGNVHGISGGSCYSFDADYYRDLGPVVNDPHGVGIVLLAGVETERLRRYFTDATGV